MASSISPGQKSSKTILNENLLLYTTRNKTNMKICKDQSDTLNEHMLWQ